MGAFIRSAGDLKSWAQLSALRNGAKISCTGIRHRDRQMTEVEKEKARATAVAGVGAGVGGASGATVGVLELAAQGAVTGLSASVVIGVGAAVGAVTFFLGYKAYRHLRKTKG